MYTSKFLVVEGEIKEGDWYLYTDILNKIHLIQFLDKGTRKGNDGKKVKLFLCSRDIEVGDKAYNILTNEEFIVEKIDVSTGETYYIAFGVLSPECNTIKVLGEISPDALSYVKEGQEFDESDIMFLIEGPGFFNVCTEKEFVNEKTLTKYSIKIKGPCSHFH